MKHQQTVQLNWPKHSRTGNCFVCTIVAKQGNGGGRHALSSMRGYGKSVDPSSPFNLHDDNIVEYLSTVSCLVPITLDIIGHAGEESIFICVLCQSIISRPSVQTLCEHNFCATCLTACLQYTACETIKCPTYNCVVAYVTITRSPRILNVQLDNLTVVCNKCTKIGKLSQVVNHQCSELNPPTPKITVVRAPNSHSSSKKLDSQTEISAAAKLLKNLASTHKDGSPIPREIEEVADKWTWVKLKRDKAATCIKTGGRLSILNLFKGFTQYFIYYKHFISSIN